MAGENPFGLQHLFRRVDVSNKSSLPCPRMDKIRTIASKLSEPEQEFCPLKFTQNAESSKVSPKRVRRGRGISANPMPSRSRASVGRASRIRRPSQRTVLLQIPADYRTGKPIDHKQALTLESQISYPPAPG